MRFSVLLATAIAVAVPVAASATTLQVVTGTRAATLSFFDPIGQSFTAVDANLTSFGFQFQAYNPGANDPLMWSLYAGETLSGTAIATRAFTVPLSVNSSTPTWVDFDVTGTTVTVGQTYTAVLTTSSSPRVAITFGPNYDYSTGMFGPDGYADGHMIVSPGNDPDSTNHCTGASNTCDISFRVTGSTPAAAAVPEPASWAMMVGGFGLLGAAMRRRRPVSFAR